MPSTDTIDMGQWMVEPLEHPDEVAATFRILGQLRPSYTEVQYDAAVRRMRKASTYALAGARDGGRIVAVAGYRTGESLAWGRYLFVDDLVTDEASRSHGAGRALLAWLKRQAKEGGRAELHLDSGTARYAAHRFYLRERLNLVFFHFVRALEPGLKAPAKDPAVREAETDEDILATAQTMLQLRPNIAPQDYLATVHRLQAEQGFHVAALWERGRAVCVAGYRFGESLSRGRHLYLDDLSTDATLRSRGAGRTMMDWLLAAALENKCGQFVLDSGTQRHDAHRFYLRERMRISAFHFKSEPLL